MKCRVSCAMGLLLLLAVATVVVAQSVGSPLGETVSLTARAFYVSDAGFETVDLAPGFGDETALGAAFSSGDAVVRVRALDDGSSATLTRCWVRMVGAASSDAPTSAALVGTTASTTGIAVQEGDELWLVVKGRWLAVKGETGNSLVQVHRAQ